MLITVNFSAENWLQACAVGDSEVVDNFDFSVDKMLIDVDKSRLAHRISIRMWITTDLSTQIRRVIHILSTIGSKICKYGSYGLVIHSRRAGQEVGQNGCNYHESI